MAIRTIVEKLTLTRPIGPQTEALARLEAMLSAAIAAAVKRETTWRNARP